ncbi:ABC transporter permease [Paenibacillus sp. GCM10012306]|uniref:ABC transporter permease n=1 Tax=Paenibacillus sp. GCM10012306 TaxID=3317342 RepID=UPI00361B2BA1
MLTILKNNYSRMLARLPLVVIMTVLMLGMISLAVYFTGLQQVRGHIVLISGADTVPIHSELLNIDILSKEPPRSTLVKHRYDAIVKENGNGQYDITTLKNDEYQAMLTNLLQHPEGPAPVLKGDRGVGSNIIGFLMLFLLMSTFMNLFTFSEDREKGELKRVILSPVSLIGYLAAHILYCMSMFLPLFLALVVMKLSGLAIGFTLVQYALLLLVISALGVSIALLLYTLFDKPDNASMLGNSVLALSTILSGSFYSFSQNNPVLDTIVSVLPQKQILNAAVNLEQPTAGFQLWPWLYPILLIGLLLSFTIFKLNRQYVQKS